MKDVRDLQSLIASFHRSVEVVHRYEAAKEAESRDIRRITIEEILTGVRCSRKYRLSYLLAKLNEHQRLIYQILNEKDCIKVKPKGWLDKQVWKEINDMLRVHQFAWLSSAKDSCWIKMQA